MIVDPDGLIMHNEQLQTKALVPLDLQNDSIAGVEVIPKAFRSVSPSAPVIRIVQTGSNSGAQVEKCGLQNGVLKSKLYTHIHRKNNRDHLQNQDSTDFYSMSRQSLGNTKVLCLWRRLAWCRSWDLHRASAGERYTDNSWKPKNGQESKSEYQKRKPSGCPGVSHWLKPWWQAISWYSLDDKRMCFMPGWLHTFCWETNRN